MKKLALGLSAVLLLSSCQNSRQMAMNQQSDRDYCQSIGAEGSKFADCMMYRDAARQQQRQARNEALIRFGAQMNQMSQPRPAPRIVNTSCQTYAGGMTNCTTFQ